MPIVVLSVINILPFSMKGVVGLILSLAAILWATKTATGFFEKVLQLNEQKYLIAYPIFLFYLIFVILTIF